MDEAKQQEFEMVKGCVGKHLPLLSQYIEYSETLENHSRKLFQFSNDPVHIARQAPLRAMVAQYTDRVHGAPIHVESPLAINIMDHHTMLNNPLSLATNIVANAFTLLNSPRKPLVVFTTSIPSQENYFSDMRFRGKRIQFFSKHELPQQTCFLPVHDFHFIDRLRASKKWNEFTAEDQTFLAWFEELITTIDYSRAQSLNDQISIMNRVLFRYLFAQDCREMAPDLFYVSNEDIIRECAHHIFEEDTFFSRSIFDPVLRSRVIAREEGLQGCWDKEHGRGTHFFWYRKENNRIAPLWLDGDMLVSQDGSFRLPLSPQTVINALHEWKILPNLFMIYGWMTFFAGVRPLVGFGSMDYISKMKAAWLDILASVDDGEQQRIASTDTQGLIGGLVVTYKRDGDVLRPQYALDVIADGGLRKLYLEHLAQMPFNALLAPALLEIYRMYLPAEDKKEHSVQPSDVMGSAFDWIR